jgi:hypothetical protein
VDPVEDDTGAVPVEDDGAGEASGDQPEAQERPEPATEATTEGPGDVDPAGGSERGHPVDGTDDGAGADADDDAESRDPLRFNNWMKRSATGAVMTGIAVGLQQALQLPRQEPAFVIEASGEPHDPNRPIDLHFDPDNPADTVAIIRRPASKAEPEEPSPSD